MDQLAPATRVHLAAGTYNTRGVKLINRCRYNGSGKDATIIRMEEDVLATGGPTLASVLYNYDVGGFHDSIEITDMTLDCNRDNQSLISAGSKGTLNALSTASRNARILRVRAIGTWANPGERFPFSVWSSGGADGESRVEIDACENLNPAGTTTAISAWGAPQSRIAGYIRNCLVTDGPESAAFGAGGWKNFRVSGNVTRNVGAGIVIDTWDYEDVVIERNQFQRTGKWGICYNGAGAYRNIIVRQNYFGMEPSAEWALGTLEAAARTTIIGNQVEQKSAAWPAFVIGAKTTGTIANNIVQEKIRSAFWRSPKLQVRNNRTPSGRALRFPRFAKPQTTAP
jgi:hypothetical protein